MRYDMRRVKRYLREQRITQRELARSADISYWHVSRMLNGNIDATERSLNLIARGLGIGRLELNQMIKEKHE